MTEEAQHRSFENYLAAKKAVAAYGVSDEFDDDPHFTRAASNSAYSAVNLPGVLTADPHVQAIPDFYMPFGVGKTCVILSTFRRKTAKFSGSNVIGPVHTTTTSGSSEAAFISTQSASMASEPAVTEEQSVDEIIGRMRATLPARYNVKLATRLTELEQLVQEEEPDGRGIEVGSLLQFVTLLEAYPQLRCPVVSVSPDRNIYASWKSGKDRVFSIHFLPDGRVRFVVFYPNDKHAEDVIRLSGTATADMIMIVAAPHGVLSWAAE